MREYVFHGSQVHNLTHHNEPKPPCVVYVFGDGFYLDNVWLVFPHFIHCIYYIKTQEPVVYDFYDFLISNKYICSYKFIFQSLVKTKSVMFINFKIAILYKY